MFKHLMAYIPPNKRGINAQKQTYNEQNNDNAYSEYQQRRQVRPTPQVRPEPQVRFSDSRPRNEQAYTPRNDYDDELQAAYKRQIEQINELTTENKRLKSELEATQAKLNVYTSKDPKVSKAEFDALNAKFEEYKRIKYNEFKTFKEKLDNHNAEVLQLNRELKQFEDKLKKSDAEAQRWKSSFQESQNKLKAQIQKSQIVKPNPVPNPVQQLEDEHFIQDDWNGLIQAVDFVLSLDKKNVPRQINIAALKYTRQLLNAHQ